MRLVNCNERYQVNEKFMDLFANNFDQLFIISTFMEHINNKLFILTQMNFMLHI